MLLRLRQFTWALSAAVDLVGVTDLFHGRRVASIARDLSRHLPHPLPWSEDDILMAGLLHDIGVSSTEVHEHLVSEMEWHRASEHCQRGRSLLAATESLQHLAGALALHHSPWSEVADPSHPTPDQWLGNLLFLADRVDVLAATTEGDILFNYPSVVQRLEALSPQLFRPEFVEALHEATKVEAFWLLRQPGPLERHFEPWIRDEAPTDYPLSEIWTLFSLFGQCVDAKSPFTAIHSRAVSRLCTELGSVFDLGPDLVFRLGLAGLVHDIGKLRVPDRILNDPQSLAKEDFSIMKHHSFDAVEILSIIEGFEDVAQWASQHHERLDGSGYPFQLDETNTNLEVRILAVADVLQAVVQDRPYRPGMRADQVSALLTKEADIHRLDARVVGLVTSQLDHYIDLARGEQPPVFLV